MNAAGEMLLDSHPAFRSHDADEVAAFLRTQQFQAAISVHEARYVDTCINGVFVATQAGSRFDDRQPAVTWGSASGIYLGYIHYGCAIDIRNDPTRDDYRILLPIRNAAEAIVGKETVAARRGSAIISSPTRGNRLRLERDSACLNLFLKGQELKRQLAALLGDTGGAPLQFAPSIDVASGTGGSLLAFVLTAMADVDRPGSLLRNPISASFFEQFIIMGLLRSHPHNHSDALIRRERSIAPRGIKRAVDYIQANLDAPVTIADLVAASGVAGKTLWRHFRDFRGTTPMRYLRDARLDKVHESLRQAEPEQSVTEIAMAWGFAHMGRFSARYRDRFGEAPSETLKRRC